MKKLFFLLTLCTATLCASAANHFVSQTAGDDGNDGLSWATAKASITAGFGACADGDTLFIAAGTYYERVTITTGKFVSILGGYSPDGTTRDPEVFETIMDGTDLGKCLIKSEAEPTIPLLFDGLILQNSEYASSGSASYMRGNMTINNCIIRNCHSQSAAAIYAKQDNKSLPCVISNCIIELCTAASSASAIHSENATIENCIIRGCEGGYGAVTLRGGTLTNCVFYNNTGGDSWPNSGGVYNPSGVVTNCTFVNNYGAKYAGIHSDNPVYNSVFWGNKSEDGFADPANYISASPSSNNIADQGFNSAPFISLSLNENNEAEDGPHFLAPTNFIGVPKNEAQIAMMRAADWSIEAGSFLIDKGKADVAPASDIDGVTRPKGEGVDVGAYEFDPNAPIIPLEGIDIFQDSLFIYAESMAAATAIFTPRNATNRTLNWVSDNPAIATVDNHGVITGVAEGQTAIRATSVDGGFTDYVIAVISPKPPVLYPKEVLAADSMYKIEDYTIPSFIPFLVAKETARVDSFWATEEEIAAIADKIAAMNEAATKLIPKTEPYNMVANINGNPRTNMAFAWFTNEGITDGVVQIVAKENAIVADFENSANVLTLPAEATTTVPLRYAVSTSGLLKAAKLDSKTAFKYVSHKAQATNLTPGTAYSWRVGYEGHWSDIAHFRTQNAAQGEYSFLYMTDSHIQDAEYVENAKWCATAAAKAVPEARFCLFPGDFVETGTAANSEWEWERWFEESIRPVIMKMPMVVTDGNHDDSPLLNYDYHFNTNTEFWTAAQTKPQFHGITYSFVYGDVLFLVYSLQDWWRASGSSEASMTSTYLSNDVKNWFRQEIEKHPNTKYRVTLSHKNVFSGSGHCYDSETPLFREIMLPILKECEIDLAIQGHDHCYEVIGPVNPDTRTVVEGSVTDTIHGEINTNTNMTGIEGGTYCTDDGTLYFIGATCGRKRYYPYDRAKLDSYYDKHKVTNYFDLFTGMFGQPGAPSFTKFTVKNDCIEVNSYKANPDGSSTIFNSMRIKRNKAHTVPFLGLENVQTPMQEGEKFIRDGQLLILKNGRVYNMLGQQVEQK